MSNKPISFKLVYNRKNELDETGTALIQIRAYKDNAAVFISTGIHVKPEHWDELKERIVKRNDNHTLNNRINKTIEELKGIEHNHSFNNQSFGVKELKSQWENRDTTDFTTFIEKYLSKEKNLSEATQKKMLRTLKKFRDYARGEVSFSRLDFKMIDGFNLYLIDKKIAANSRKNEFKFLSKYANLAVKQGLLEYTKNPFKDYSIKREPTNREALNEIELQKIELLVFNEKNRHLERIRDLFLFQCYTGLRFGDASRISTAHIFNTPDGMEIRISKAQKTDKAVNLPIHLLFRDPGSEFSKPEKLIQKYWREDSLPFFLSDKAQQTEAANNQYTNSELKTIQKLAGIKTKLHNHLGRHTFATFLVWRVPLPIVQELLQHSKVETTMIYITVGSERVKEQLKKVTDWY